MSPTDTLHKPKYGPPWETESVAQLLANGVSRDVWMIGRADDEMGFIAELPGFLPDEAAAIADLWGWIERAERYENVLRQIVNLSQYRQYAWQAARGALKAEGRL